MGQLTADKQNISALSPIVIPYDGLIVDSGEILYQGSAIGRDPSDSSYLKALAAAKPYYQAIGVSSVTKLTGDGVKRGFVEAGLYEFENSSSTDAIAATLPLYWPLYAADNQTAALTDGGGTRAYLGAFGGFTSNGKPAVWVGMPFGMRDIKWPVVFGFAEVAAGGAALTVDLNFGPTLPGPMRVMGFSTDALTVFSGGTIATCTLSLGTSAGGTQIHTALDIFTGAAAAPKKGTAGSLGYNCAPLAGGVQIQGRVTTTTGNVSAATAGAYVGSIILRPGS